MVGRQQADPSWPAVPSQNVLTPARQQLTSNGVHTTSRIGSQLGVWLPDTFDVIEGVLAAPGSGKASVHVPKTHYPSYLFAPAREPRNYIEMSTCPFAEREHVQ